MLTSYWVTCPRDGCRWSGSLLPMSNPASNGESKPQFKSIWFRCPRCEREWATRLVGEDVHPLPDHGTLPQRTLV